jgi:hypothetical protein
MEGRPSLGFGLFVLVTIRMALQARDVRSQAYD